MTSSGVPDRGPAVFAVTTATLVLSSIFVAARLVSRIGIVRRVGWDDYTIILAWLFAFALSLTIDLGTRVGLGKHTTDIPEQDKAPLKICEYVFSVLYNPALMATKTSILIFYLRLSKDTEKVLRYASWLVLIIVNVAGLVLTFMNIFQCRPINTAFEKMSSGSAKCLPLLTEFICSAPVNVVTDLAILALPIPVLTGMRLPPRQKTILVLTFTLGVFVSVVDVVRIYYLQQAITNVSTGSSSNPNSIFGDSPDFPWNASLSLMWSAVEVNVGITCACIPTLKPLIIRILPAMLIDPNGTNNKSDSKDAIGSSPGNNSGEGRHAHRERLNHDEAQFPPAARAWLDRAEGTEMSMMEFLTTPDWVRPAPRDQAQHDPGNLDTAVIDFLTTPDMVAPNAEAQGATHADDSTPPQVTNSPTMYGSTAQENSVYFGFVNIKRPKSMLKVSVSDSFKYCTTVTILFFLWGFSYGLLNILNNSVATVSGMSMAQTLGLTSAYFGIGYFFGPLLVGEWILRHDEHHRSMRKNSRHRQEDSVGGFKATFIVGLCIYGTGTIMLWPSAVLTSYAGFMVSNTVVGFGLGVLETGANPFIALCGPAEYSEMRLCLAQGVQAVGSVLSGLLSQDVLFADLTNHGYHGSLTLLDTQWTYLAITLFCVLLALFFYYMPLPEVADAELERAAEGLAVDNKKRNIGGLRLQTVCLILAVLAQWTYVACQEILSEFFEKLLLAFAPPSTPRAAASPDSWGQVSWLAISIPNYLLIGQTAFAISRFTAGYLAYLNVKYHGCPLIPTPRTTLSLSVAGCIVCSILVVALKPIQNSNLLVIPVILLFFFEGPLWPLIFSIGLRGQGKRTKRAGAYLTMGASGALFFPFVVYGIVVTGGTVQIGFVVIIALFVVTSLYPLYLTLSRDAKMLTNPVASRLLPEGQNRRASSFPEEDGLGGAGTMSIELDEIIKRRRRSEAAAARAERKSKDGSISPLRRLSKVLLAATWKRRRASSAPTTPPLIEHREDSTGASKRQQSPLSMP